MQIYTKKNCARGEIKNKKKGFSFEKKRVKLGNISICTCYTKCSSVTVNGNKFETSLGIN